MRGFDRQAEPDFWGAYERQWLHETTGPTVDPLAWKRDKRTLANHFHDHVRAKGEPRRCAYCDGPLGAESRATIDDAAQLGPYRFVARKFLVSKKRLPLLM